MDNKQALDILTQGINIALGSGAFKNTKDVAIINQAIETLNKNFSVVDAKEAKVSPGSEMTKESK